MDNFSSGKLQAIAVISAIAVSMAAGAFFAFGNPLVSQAYSQSSATLSSSPSIKVTGDATTSIIPDQATITVNVQTQPDDLDSVLAEQDKRIAEITQAVEGIEGATVSIGYRNISPYYSGYGMPASDDVTFNIYATTTIQTDIDQLSGLISALAEAGFGFESVYIDPYYSAQFMREAGVSAPSEGGEERTEVENPITIGVTLSVEPAVLSEAIEEYEEKYRAMVAVLEEQGISDDQIQNNNFNIYPYYYGNGPVSSYQANTQVIIKTSPDNINEVTTAVKEIEKGFIENVIISVSDEAIDNARKELTDQAIANARERASEMVEALGLEVAGIKSIEAATGSSISPYGGEFMYRGVKIVQPYYYQSVSGDIAVSITVEFELAAGAQ